MPSAPTISAAFAKSRQGLRTAMDWLAGVWGGVFYLDSRPAGLLMMMLALAAAWRMRPTIALGGLLALCTCALLQRLSGSKPEVRVSINCLLIGLGAGYAFGTDGDARVWAAFTLVTVAAAALVFVLARALLAVGARAGLPVLSLPFAIGLVFLQMAGPALGGAFNYAHVPDTALWPALDAALPPFLAVFSHDLGSVLFMPDTTAGLCFFAVILWQSRLLALHGLLAHAFGLWLLGLWLGNQDAAMHHPSGFNFLLTGFALGAFFLLPSRGSAAFSAIGVLVCTMLVVALGRAAALANATPSTLPFNLTVIGILALLRRGGSPLMPLRHHRTPEETLDAQLCNRARFGADPALALPFPGTCRVYQAFDGPWTHQGPWRHAYDFVRIGEDGLSYRNNGLMLADYHLFGLEVLSPAAGSVVACRDDLPDNPPGLIDHVNNWGNFVILCMPGGLHVELSHLQQHSLRVKPGDVVRPGQVLALCGNSGYSLYPHLHMQVQVGPWLGDETVPFTFHQAFYGGRLHTACLPEVGTDVTAPPFAATPSPLALTLGEVLAFDWSDGSGKTRTELFSVRRTRDIHACFYFEDESGNTLRFAADASGYTALDYAGSPRSALAFFAAALPSLPNLSGGGRWRDHVPVRLACGFVHRNLLLLASALGCRPASLGVPRRGSWKLRADGGAIRGRVLGRPSVRIAFDAQGRLDSIQSACRKLSRRIP